MGLGAGLLGRRAWHAGEAVGGGRQFLGSSGQESLMLPKVSVTSWPEALVSLETWAGTLANRHTAVPTCKDLSQTVRGTKGGAWSRAATGHIRVCCPVTCGGEATRGACAALQTGRRSGVWGPGREALRAGRARLRAGRSRREATREGPSARSAQATAPRVTSN